LGSHPEQQDDVDGLHSDRDLDRGRSRAEAAQEGATGGMDSRHFRGGGGDIRLGPDSAGACTTITTRITVASDCRGASGWFDEAGTKVISPGELMLYGVNSPMLFMWGSSYA
jgi:hypothetical protein